MNPGERALCRLYIEEQAEDLYHTWPLCAVCGHDPYPLFNNEDVVNENEHLVICADCKARALAVVLT